MTLLDYSAGKISGAAIRNAGHAGSVRYITDRNSLTTKHTSRSEYADHIANGLQVWLVYEVNTNDPLGGRAGGVTAAQRALDGANYIGYPGDKHIFFCFDRHATAAELPAWQAYLDGAASVLGVGRVGAYGFSEAIDAARGHATAFWQCGSRSAVRGWTNFYQRNTGTTVVGGITCDINDVLVPISEDDVALGGDDFKYLFYNNPVQEFGNFSQLLAEVKDKSRASAAASAEANANAVAAKASAAAVQVAVADLQSKVANLSVPAVDVDALAAKVAPLVAAAIQVGLASAVADELNRRLAS